MPEEPVSFAMRCKEEAMAVERQPLGYRALLSAFAKGSGSLRLSQGKEELDLVTESAPIAKTLYLILTQGMGEECRFAYTRGMGFRKKVKYHVLVAKPEALLEQLEVDFLSPLLPSFVRGEEAKKGYVAGAFISTGSVNDPSSSNYHLEIACDSLDYAKRVSRLINRSETAQFDSKIASRRKESVVYIKRSQTIADFLVLIGADACCLDFENVRVSRDFANIGNRLENLDVANMGKQTVAAERQIQEIVYLRNKGVLAHHPNPKLILLAELRLEHQDASLADLAGFMSEELASTVTKSNINHLFRNLHALYEEESKS
ncbi:MAG: DNA-binding protein WhiA [Bacilli bacterium]|nr:DNA-binding protein WhiA [Bacilli bacterium]